MSENKGEIEIKKILDKSCGKKGWKVFYNRLLKERNFETDAIVVTPKGLFVIEVKNLYGKVKADGLGNWLLKNLRNKVVKVKSGWCQVIKRADQIKKIFIKKGKTKGYLPVFPVVVFNNENCETKSISSFADGSVVKKNGLEKFLAKTFETLGSSINFHSAQKIVSSLPQAF